MPSTRLETADQLPFDNDLAGSYTSTATYNPDGSLKTSTLPAAGGLPAETLSYTYNTIGLPTKLSGLATYVGSTLYTQWDTIASLGMGAVAGQGIYQGFVRDEATLRLAQSTVDRLAAPVTDETTTLATQLRQPVADPLAGSVRRQAGYPTGHLDWGAWVRRRHHRCDRVGAGRCPRL